MGGKRYNPYNKGNVCDRCRENDRITDDSRLYPGHARKENDKNGNWTGRWNCPKCYQKYDSNSHNNIMKSLAGRRTGNPNPDHENIKGDNSENLVCELYGYENLNKKYDNYRTEIDCYDPKTGLYHQVRGRWYNPKYKFWGITILEMERFKKYEDIICICCSEDGNVERIYRFPLKLVKEKEIKHINIYRYDFKGRPYESGWYEKFRIIDIEEIKKANLILKQLIMRDSKQNDVCRFKKK